MRHYLSWFAALGLVGIPTVAAACWPMWDRPVFAPRVFAPRVYAPRVYVAPMYPAPMYAPPMYAYPPVYVAPSVWQQPAPGPTLLPPRVETTPKQATPVPAPAPDTAPPRRAPVVEPDPPVRPAAGSDAPPKQDAPPNKDAAPPFPLDLKFPEIAIPKNLQPEPKPVSKKPDPASVPKVPAVGGSKEPFLPAIPSPAPAPEPSIPPPALPLPGAKLHDPWPSLTLPPDTPVKPPAKSDSTSRSSPLTGTGLARELVVKVFPAGRNEQATGVYRTVGFFNHTNRDLGLTIEGRAVKLPARSYLHAQLAATFMWGCESRPAARETVPEGAAGLDVVFRE